MLPGLELSPESLDTLEDTPNYLTERFLEESQENTLLVRVESYNSIYSNSKTGTHSPPTI